MRVLTVATWIMLVLASLCAQAAEPDAEGFVSLFDGKELAGWIGDTKGYVPDAEGNLVCSPGGNLYTEKEYGDFVFRFDFKLTPGANNGVGIRTPTQGDSAYVGMEIQILDDSAPKWAKLQPYQYHGSIYGVVPVRRGHQKPVGEWNSQEIIAKGGRIIIVLNGVTVVNADLDEVIKSNKTADGGGIQRHPGLLRKSGHIGFLGHGDKLWFRNIRIKELKPDDPLPEVKPVPAAEDQPKSDAAPSKSTAAGPLNTPPEGFVALFNGKDLTGWKGIVGNPKSRAAMTPEQLAAAQKATDEQQLPHWKAVDGILVFDGKGQSLCTAKDYGDFELYVDWKIEKGGDSGIYLRGTPQVQIWENPVGSGGLFNNQKNSSKPLVAADNPIRQWNTFTIKMVGERVTVKLNDQLVVDNVVLENYWERDKPIYPTGQIELQNHGNTLYFRNIYLRELPR